MTEDKPVVSSLDQHRISADTGYAMEEPLEHLPRLFLPWETIGKSTHILVEMKHCKEAVDQIPTLDALSLEDHDQLRLAHVLLTVIAHGWVWEQETQGQNTILPPQLGIPLGVVSEKLGLPPVFSQSDLIANWRLNDKSKPASLENITPIVSWPGSPKNDAFFKTLVRFELDAAPAIKAIHGGLKGGVKSNGVELVAILEKINESINKMHSTTEYMQKHLNPDDYYFKARKYFQGWDKLENGLLLGGYSDIPFRCVGGNAAQSAVFPTIDAFLGIKYSEAIQLYLDTMLNYMLPSHRKFVKIVKNSSRFRNIGRMIDDISLRSAYNACIDSLVRFRSYHLIVVTRYIVIPSKKESDMNGKYGTGGTHFMNFLKAIRDETKSHRYPD